MYPPNMAALLVCCLVCFIRYLTDSAVAISIMATRRVTHMQNWRLTERLKTQRYALRDAVICYKILRTDCSNDLLPVTSAIFFPCS